MNMTKSIKKQPNKNSSMLKAVEPSSVAGSNMPSVDVPSVDMTSGMLTNILFNFQIEINTLEELVNRAMDFTNNIAYDGAPFPADAGLKYPELASPNTIIGDLNLKIESLVFLNNKLSTVVNRLEEIN